MPYHSQGILVAGGSHNRQVYFLDLDTLTWEPKQNVPIDMYMAAVIPYRDSVLIAGGHVYGETTELNTIYYYDPALDDWELLATMSEGRGELVAFMVPDSYVNCV